MRIGFAVDLGSVVEIWLLGLFVELVTFAFALTGVAFFVLVAAALDGLYGDSEDEREE